MSGAPETSAYSLRSTLGLRQPAASVTTRSFQQGASGYAGVVDDGVYNLAPDTSYGTVTQFKVEEHPADLSTLLISFNDLFGSGPNQIPHGATITSASLRVAQLNDSAIVA